MEGRELLRRCPFCAEPIKVEAVKCKHCRAMLPVVAPPRYHQVGAASSGQGVPRWVLPVAIVGLTIGVTFALSSRTLVLGALIIVGVPIAIVTMLVGRYATSAPAAMKSSSRFLFRHLRWSLALAVALWVGAMAGFSERRTAVSNCEDARSHARSLQKNGAGPDALVGPFSRAADACAEAGLEDERAEMAEASSEANEEARRQEAQRRKQERDARYKAALSAAREHAADPKAAVQAIDKFAEAAGLGTLPPEDTATYARLLRLDGERLAGDAQFRQSLERLKKARALSGEASDLDALIAKIEVQARDEQVGAWVEQADAVGRDTTSCGIANKVKEAWSGLKQVTKTDRQYRQAKSAARRLERCRRRLERDFTKAGRAIRRAQRESWASEYETKLLDEGMDVRVRLGGRYKDTVKIVFVLFNRAWAHKITNGGSTAPGSFLGQLERIGFKSVTFSDGYYESYRYRLEPDDEGAMGEMTLREMGLGQPLEL